MRARRQDDLTIHGSGHLGFPSNRLNDRRFFRWKSGSNPTMIIPVRGGGTSRFFFEPGVIWREVTMSKPYMELDDRLVDFIG